MKRVIIIHGYGGVPEGCWKPWLKIQLENKGFQVEVLKMPNTDEPKLSEWLTVLEEAIGLPDEKVFLVGHSLGCPTILQYLSNLPENKKIGGAIFVAGRPSFENIDEVSEFFAQEKIEEAKKHCDKFAVIYSNNDQFVPVDKELKFAEEIHAEKIFVEGKGHFSDEDGVFELPEALNVILEMSNESR